MSSSFTGATLFVWHFLHFLPLSLTFFTAAPSLDFGGQLFHAKLFKNFSAGNKCCCPFWTTFWLNCFSCSSSDIVLLQWETICDHNRQALFKLSCHATCSPNKLIKKSCKMYASGQASLFHQIKFPDEMHLPFKRHYWGPQQICARKTFPAIWSFMDNSLAMILDFKGKPVLVYKEEHLRCFHNTWCFFSVLP